MRSQCPFPSPPGGSDTLAAGDVRVVVQPTLASLHTLFLNEHNRIAAALLAHGHSVDDEELFQVSLFKSVVLTFPLKVARQLVGAELQQVNSSTSNIGLKP